MSSNYAAAKNTLFEKILIDYFRPSKALYKECTNNTNPTPYLQVSTFNTNMKSSFTGLKEYNINFIYEKNYKKYQVKVATKFEELINMVLAQR